MAQTKEEILERQRKYEKDKWDNASPEEKNLMLAKSKHYAKTHRDKINAQVAKRYEQNPEKAIKVKLRGKEYAKQYYKEHYNYRRKTPKLTKEEQFTKTKLNQKKGNLKRLFGITIEYYNELFTQQAGYCAICGRHQSEFTRALAIDHDHTTGKIRGLLCSKCNAAIGLMKEDIQVLLNAVEYIVKNK